MFCPDPLSTLHSDILLALPLPHPTPPFCVYFYIKYTIHFFYPAAYKCTINELVVCNHRMRPKANSEPLLTCQPLILYDSATPQPKPHPATHLSLSDETKRKRRGNKSFTCQTVTCLNKYITAPTGCYHPQVSVFGSYRHVGATWKYLLTCSPQKTPKSIVAVYLL